MYIVGTLYKSMKLKPSVLDQFKDSAGISAPVEPLSNYTDDEDTMVLEDESGRVMLTSSSRSLRVRSTPIPPPLFSRRRLATPHRNQATTLHH
jgi:DNA polymerase delta subunit 2